MRCAKILVWMIGMATLGHSQTSGGQPAMSAQQLMAKAVAAMSASQSAGEIRAYSLQGVMQRAGSSEGEPIKVQARGRYDMRVEINMREGTHSVALLGGRGKIKDRFGKESVASGGPPTGTEIAFLPLPALIGEVAAQGQSGSFLGTEMLDGRLVHHVSFSTPSTQEKAAAGILQGRSQTEFFIDAETFLVVKIRHLAFDSRGQRPLVRELSFSDYRPSNGLLLPFTLAETISGQRTWTISVNSIELNPKLTDASFQ